ncbi:MAG: hypothetical protein NWE99_02305, partial [Candidatus Bathyarchaeota archaeon]|nr:hypothetical protein [Candidatus Bathyarchaeota archaeon]
KEALEKKSQFFLSLLTLILGALFLNTDMLAEFNRLTLAFPTLRLLLCISATILMVSLSVGVISILASVWLQSYIREYPTNVVSSLFDPKSNYLEEKSANHLLASLAMNCALALEINKKVNDRKAKWMIISSICTLVSVIALSISLAIVLLSLFLA